MNPPIALLDVARDALAARLAKRDYKPPAFAPPWDVSRGVFVTWFYPNGDLRGCIGHLAPYHPTLADEVAACSVSSGLEDNRFSPVRKDELPTLHAEVSILSPSERTTLAGLDPRVYGVVVSYGRRRGVLLPDLEGIDTVDQQVSIALKKAQLSANDPYEVERFTILKVAGQPRKTP